MQSTTSLPRNYASTHLKASYPGSCFDFTDLMSFATLHPVDSFQLDPEDCPSSTPCSEAEDGDNDTPLELTYSGSTSKSTSTSSSSRTSSAPMTRLQQDDVIEGVIKKLEGYSLARPSKVEAEVHKKISRNGLMGMRPEIVSKQDCMLWTRVWGSATAVRNAKERRERRLGRKDKARLLSSES